jgi:hypothetical protein
VGLSQEEYAATNGEICPVCEAKRVARNGDPKGQHNLLFLGLRCESCGSTWYMRLKLEGYSDVQFNIPGNTSAAAPSPATDLSRRLHELLRDRALGGAPDDMLEGAIYPPPQPPRAEWGADGYFENRY